MSHPAYKPAFCTKAKVANGGGGGGGYLWDTLACRATSCTSGLPPTMIIICLVGSSITTWSP